MKYLIIALATLMITVIFTFIFRALHLASEYDDSNAEIYENELKKRENNHA